MHQCLACRTSFARRSLSRCARLDCPGRRKNGRVRNTVAWPMQVRWVNLDEFERMYPHPDDSEGGAID